MAEIQEREVKIIDVDPDTVRTKLRDNGIEKKTEGRIRSQFYDFPDGRIEEQGVLRLRSYGDDQFITYKEMTSQDNIKEMRELEIDIDDMETTAAMFEALGLEKIRSSSKYREKWTQGEIEYVLDKYDDIPWVLEIEAPGTEQLEAAVTDLGYTMDETKTWDAQQLRSHYDAD